MPSILTFALVAPMASFGGIAVGERRGGWDRPARSAILGLLGACLGVDRQDDDAQAALANQYGIALLCHAPGQVLADFHTAQMPDARRGRVFPTRARELRAPDLNTVLSQRDYRTGAWHLGALWSRSTAPRWPLAFLQDAMRRPVFVPCLGRKSCPLGLPLAPIVLESPDPVSALLDRHANGPEAALLAMQRPGSRPGNRSAGTPLRDVLANRPGDLLVVLDASDAVSDPRLLRVERRRDQPRSRRPIWQFDLRDEAVLRIAVP